LFAIVEQYILMAVTLAWASVGEMRVLSDVATSVAFAIHTLCLNRHSCVESSCVMVQFSCL